MLKKSELKTGMVIVTKSSKYLVIEQMVGHEGMVFISKDGWNNESVYDEDLLDNDRHKNYGQFFYDDLHNFKSYKETSLSAIEGISDIENKLSLTQTQINAMKKDIVEIKRKLAL